MQCESTRSVDIARRTATILCIRTGRRKACAVAILALLLADVGMVLAPAFIWFLVARVLVGFGVGGVGVVSYVWGRVRVE